MQPAWIKWWPSCCSQYPWDLHLQSVFPRTSITIVSGSPGKRANKFTLLFVGNEPVKRRGIIGGISRALPKPALGKVPHISTSLTPSLEGQYPPFFSLNIFKSHPHISPPRSKKTPDAGPIFGYMLHCKSISSQRLRRNNPGQ